VTINTSHAGYPYTRDPQSGIFSDVVDDVDAITASVASIEPEACLRMPANVSKALGFVRRGTTGPHSGSPAVRVEPSWLGIMP
jgi:hypothetical protein